MIKRRLNVRICVGNKNITASLELFRMETVHVNILKLELYPE